MAVTIRLFAMYELTADGTGATGLTVTVDVDKFAKSDGTKTRVTTAAPAVEGANGIYHYAVANVSDLATQDYVAVFKTSATTVKTKHFAFLLQDLVAAATQIMSNIDATVSSRLASSSYAASPTAADNADAVWDEVLSGHAIAGSAGSKLTTAGAASDPLLNPVPGSYTSGMAGYALGGMTPERLAKLDTISASSVILADPFESAEDIRVQLGNDYYAVDGRALEFTGTAWPVLTGGAISMVVYGATTTTVAGSVLSASSCRIELPKATIATIGVGFWSYTLKVVLTNTHTVTLVNGTLAVMEL